MVFLTIVTRSSIFGVTQGRDFGVIPEAFFLMSHIQLLTNIWTQHINYTRVPYLSPLLLPPSCESHSCEYPSDWSYMFLFTVKCKLLMKQVYTFLRAFVFSSPIVFFPSRYLWSIPYFFHSVAKIYLRRNVFLDFCKTCFGLVGGTK